jgi:CHRD domain
MNRKTRLLASLAAAALVSIGTPALADPDVVVTRLTGYEETPTLNTGGSATFVARISEDGTSISYELTYGGFATTVTQSHIHFGRPAIAGSIVLFLCTNLGNAPAGVQVQACPPQPATITGTLTAADVVAVPAQGIDAGTAGFAEILKAIRSRAAYVNIHTTQHPPGEIRGQLP